MIERRQFQGNGDFMDYFQGNFYLNGFVMKEVRQTSLVLAERIVVSRTFYMNSSTLFSFESLVLWLFFLCSFKNSTILKIVRQSYCRGIVEKRGKMVVGGVHGSWKTELKVFTSYKGR